MRKKMKARAQKREWLFCSWEPDMGVVVAHASQVFTETGKWIYHEAAEIELTSRNENNKKGEKV